MWDYRVVKTKNSYKVVEVIYNNDKTINGWVDTNSILEWDNYNDLKGTAEMVLDAFKKPILIVGENNILSE